MECSNPDPIQPYSEIAVVYDYLLRHVDYQAWYRYIKDILERYVENPRVLVELGCGTGRFGAKFSRDGFLIYGIDRSLNMLRVAKTRAYNNFRLICADITDFCLAEKADFIFSVHDTMNYITESDRLKRVLQCTSNIMNKDSIFMFDITTEYNIYTNFQGKKSEYAVRDMLVHWDNTYDSEDRIITSVLTLQRNDGTVSVEEHRQRIYTVEEISDLLDEEGFRIIDIFGDYTFKSPVNDTVMINFITEMK